MIMHLMIEARTRHDHLGLAPSSSPFILYNTSSTFNGELIRTFQLVVKCNRLLRISKVILLMFGLDPLPYALPPSVSFPKVFPQNVICISSFQASAHDDAQKAAWIVGTELRLG